MKKKNKQIIENYAIIIVLGIMITACVIFVPRFSMMQNIFNVGKQISINGILAVGMTCVILTAGIDLSIGSTLALAGLMAAMIAEKIQNQPPAIMNLVCFTIAIATGMICGLFNGIVITKFRVTPFITTLANLSIISGVCYLITDSRPIYGLPESITWVGQEEWGKIPVAVIILIAVVGGMAIVLKKTAYGRYIYAVGGNEEVARLSGICIEKIKLSVYVISGTLAALAGFIYMSRLQAGIPNAGDGYELQAIAATVVGGTRLSGGAGTITKTFTGAMIIGVANNAMSLLKVSSYWQKIFVGLIILIAVAFNEYINSKEQK